MGSLTYNRGLRKALSSNGTGVNTATCSACQFDFDMFFMYFAFLIKFDINTDYQAKESLLVFTCDQCGSTY